jgi:hypothetical protein
MINFYQTTRRYNPEDSHLRTHRRENLKSYLYVRNWIDLWDTPVLTPNSMEWLLILMFRVRELSGSTTNYLKTGMEPTLEN